MASRTENGNARKNRSNVTQYQQEHMAKEGYPQTGHPAGRRSGELLLPHLKLTPCWLTQLMRGSGTISLKAKSMSQEIVSCSSSSWLPLHRLNYMTTPEFRSVTACSNWDGLRHIACLGTKRYLHPGIYWSCLFCALRLWFKSTQGLIESREDSSGLPLPHPSHSDSPES